MKVVRWQVPQGGLAYLGRRLWAGAREGQWTWTLNPTMAQTFKTEEEASAAGREALPGPYDLPGEFKVEEEDNATH